MKSIVYLSARPHGEEMLKLLQGWQKGMDFLVTKATVNDDPFDWLKDAEYDFGINFMGTRKIPEDQLFSADGKHRWLNFHPAPLPEYRGRNVAYHAIMNNSDFFGATLHWMDADYDTGPIIAVDKFGLDGSETARDLYEMSVERLKRLFKAWVPYLLSYGKLVGEKQNDMRAHYYEQHGILNTVYMESKRKEDEIRAKMFFPKYIPEIIIGGIKYLIIPEAAWRAREVPKPTTSREADLFCDHCQKRTKHYVIDSVHERDASGDYRKCLECHWAYTGLAGEYQPPSFDP